MHTEAGELKADLVVLGLGVQPNAELAGAAGIDLGSSGAIANRPTAADQSRRGVGRRRLRRVVPSGLATADPHGAGDGGQSSGPGRRHQHRRWLRRLRRGRHGGDEDLLTEIARTGLNEREATTAGFDGAAVTVEHGGAPATSQDAAHGQAGGRAGHRPAARRPDRRRGGSAAKRIDVLAVAITSGMTVGEMINVDLSYAPPFSSVWDPVVVAARRPRAPCRRPASLAVGVRSRSGAEPAEPAEPARPPMPSRASCGGARRWPASPRTGLGFCTRTCTSGSGSRRSWPWPPTSGSQRRIRLRRRSRDR